MGDANASKGGISNATFMRLSADWVSKVEFMYAKLPDAIYERAAFYSDAKTHLKSQRDA